MKPGPDRLLKVVFGLLIVANLPLAVLAGLILLAQLSGELRDIYLFGGQPLTWFGALEEFIGLDFENPELVAGALGLAYLAHLFAYLWSLLPRFMERPFWRLMLLHAQIGIPLAFLVGAYLPPDLDTLEEARDALPLLAIVAVFVPYPFLAWRLELFVGRRLVRLTQRLTRRERYGAANRVLAIAVRFQPSNSELRRTMGLNSFREGKVAGAIEMLEPLLTDDCDDREMIDTLEKSYRIAHRWEDALEMERRQLRLDPALIETRIRAGRILRQLERAEEAADVLREGLPTDNLDLLELLLATCIETANSDDAVELARQIESLDVGKQEKSIGWYRKIIEADPENTTAFEELAGLLIRHRQEEEGYALYERVSELDPERYDLRLRLVDYYQEADELGRAEPHLAALTEAGRDTLDVALLYGDVLYRRDDPSEALGHFEAAAERYPEDYRFAYFLGQLHLRGGALDEAKEWADSALNSAAESRKDKRRVDALLKRIEDAFVERELAVWEQRCAEEPDAIEPRLGLIGAMSHLGLAGRALAECDALIESHPGRQAEIMAELEAFAEASEMNFRLLDCVADLNLKHGEWDKAFEIACKLAKRSLDGNRLLAEHCRRILEHQPEHVSSLRSLAQVHFDRQEWAESREIHRRLLELDGPRALDYLHRVFQASMALEDEDAAIKAAEDVAQRDASELEMRLRLVRLYAAREDFENVFRHLEAARRIDGTRAEVVRLQAEIDEKYRDYRLRELLAAIEEDPSDTAKQLEAGDLLMEIDELTKAISCYQQAARNPQIKNLAGAKQALAMTHLRMFDLVAETLDQVALVREGTRESEKATALVYRIAEMLEDEAEYERALHLYKKIFRVDADFRQVVEKIDALSETV